MGEQVLVINTGSTSKKYALYDGTELRESLHFELNGSSFLLTVHNSDGKKTEEISSDVFSQSLKCVKEKIGDSVIGIIALRIVAPGLYFTKDGVLDENYILRLKKIESRDPLHITPILDMYKNVTEIFPRIKVVGISDSAYHTTIPDKAKLYALPYEDVEKFELHRFGYHGISVESVVRKLREENALSEKIIVCHLGGGSSMTAVSEGKSIETSMGYSPLEGLVMATRPGNVDPLALITLQEEKGLNASQLKNYLYKECGIKGMSGLSSDTRVLLEAEKEGDEKGARAKRALQIYTHQVKKQIGALTAILNGLDTIVFTGTIGERSSIMRERICTDLEYLGIHLDPYKNKNETILESNIEIDDAPVQIKVIHTQEEEEMARRANLV